MRHFACRCVPTDQNLLSLLPITAPETRAAHWYLETRHGARIGLPKTGFRKTTGFLLIASLLVGQPGLLTAPPAHAVETCATSVPATSSAIESQASFADTYRHLHKFQTGAGVRVAIIDTGVSPHPRLPQLIDGGDFLRESTGGALDDCDGHGTVVASVLAAQDTGDGIVGLAPGVELIAIRQTTAQYEDPETENNSVATLIAAIDQAITTGAQVINLSLAACLPDDTDIDISPLEDVLNRAEDHNVVVVAAAGNYSEQCDENSRVIPASLPTVLAVTAHDTSLEYSDYALLPQQDYLSAKGTVTAAVSFDNTGLAGAVGTVENPMYFAGTSFATPVVSGTAALLRERYPDATAAEIRQRLYAGADDYHQVFSPSRALLNPDAASANISALHVPDAATVAPQATEELGDARSPRLTIVAWVLAGVAVIGGIAARLATRKRQA